jgi:hypothetical protein
MVDMAPAFTTSRPPDGATMSLLARNRKRLAVFTAVLIATGLTVPAAQAAPPEPAPSRVYPVFERAHNVGKGDNGFAFAGYDKRTGGVVVWRVGGGKSPQADARYTALATPDVPVTVRAALVSEKDWERIIHAIDRDLMKLKAEGIEVTGSQIENGRLDGVPPGRVQINVAHLTPAIEETLLSRYADTTLGRSKVMVVEKENDLVPASGRQNDGPPWYGCGPPSEKIKPNM